MDKETTNLYLEQLAKDAKVAGGELIYVSNRTPSMLGSPYAGNAVVVLRQPEYVVGDDIVFEAGPGKRTLHSITHVKPGFVFTKGSFNGMGDGWIPVEKIVGKVRQTIRTKK